MESNTNLKEFKKFIESDKSIKSTHKPFLLKWVEMYLEIIEQKKYQINMKMKSLKFSYLSYQGKKNTKNGK